MAVEFVTKFELLVKSVLEKRKTSYVNIFRLWLNFWVNWPRTQAIEDYIGDVMKLEPRECSVNLCLCDNLNLNTDLIFGCASLIYLQLWLSIKVSHLVYIKLNSVNLPCLNTLNLDGILMSDHSYKKLLLGCPLLEELVLVNCYIGIIEICSNSLKKLVLRSCYRAMRLQVSTPNLLYLDISVSTRKIMLLNMPLLVHASIYLPEWYDHDKYVTWGNKLIHSLSNVESLRLELDCPKGKVTYKDYSNCPVYNNLKHLKVLNWGLYHFDLALYFLHHSPKLQELTLENEHACTTEILDEKTTQEGPRYAFVQREFLKTVRIVGFENNNGYVDRLINKLLAHVKIIGEIIV